MILFPIELIISDFISMLFLTIGSFFLLRFCLKLGSKNLRIYSVLMCAFMVFYAVFHEGGEILYGLGIMETHTLFMILSIVVTAVYFIFALLLKFEMEKLINFTGYKGKKSHKPRGGKHGN